MIEFISTTAIITGVSIKVERVDTLSGKTTTLATEPRPATFADADTFLAAHSLGRTDAWELDDNGGVAAEVHKVDNRFNGTVAARLWQAVGTTHEPFAPMTARELACRETGDLISDMEVSQPYVVAGSSLDGDVAKIHMVGDGQTWSDRYSTDFHPDRLVMVARKR